MDKIFSLTIASHRNDLFPMGDLEDECVKLHSYLAFFLAPVSSNRLVWSDPNTRSSTTTHVSVDLNYTRFPIESFSKYIRFIWSKFKAILYKKKILPLQEPSNFALSLTRYKSGCRRNRKMMVPSLFVIKLI